MKTKPSYKTRNTQRRRRRRRVFFLIIVFVLLTTAIFSLIVWSDWFKIKNIEINGNHFTDADQLRDEISRYLNSDELLGFINFKNNLFWPTAHRLKSALFHQTAIQDFTLTKNFQSKTLIFNLRERKISGVLCSSSGTESCFYFDERGFIFASSPQIEGNMIFLINDGSGRIYNLGDQILAVDTFDNLIKIKNMLISHFQLDFVQIQDKDLIIQTSAGPSFYLNAEDLARTSLALDNLFNSDFNFSNLSYLDLRYLPIVYWKNAR